MKAARSETTDAAMMTMIIARGTEVTMILKDGVRSRTPGKLTTALRLSSRRYGVKFDPRRKKRRRRRTRHP